MQPEVQVRRWSPRERQAREEEDGQPGQDSGQPHRFLAMVIFPGALR
jgi:hypothetical protein